MLISPITKEYFLVLFGDNNILEGLTIKIQAFRNVRTQEFKSSENKKFWTFRCFIQNIPFTRPNASREMTAICKSRFWFKNFTKTHNPEFIWNMSCISAAQLKFWFQTDLGNENSRKFSQLLQAGKTVAIDFARYDHALVTLFVQFLCCDWWKFGRWVHE